MGLFGGGGAAVLGSHPLSLPARSRHSGRGGGRRTPSAVSVPTLSPGGSWSHGGALAVTRGWDRVGGVAHTAPVQASPTTPKCRSEVPFGVGGTLPAPLSLPFPVMVPSTGGR